MFVINFAIRSLLRNKTRVILTFFAILSAFILYGYVASIHAAFNGGVDASGADRLILQNKTSIISPLPFAYKNKIAALSSVNLVASGSWFGGYYNELANSFAQYAVDSPEDYLTIYPEIKLSDREREDWFSDRAGAIVGKSIAEKYGWEVGDKIVLTSSLWTTKSNSNDWEFNISGIFDTDTKGFSIDAMLFHYKYFDEARTWGNGYVGWLLIKINDFNEIDFVAQEIDDRFQNSSFETKTFSEKVYMKNFSSRIGDFNLVFYSLVMVIIVILFLITGNTLSHSVRERINEFAVLGVLGFTRLKIISFVALESLLLIFSAGFMGILIAYLFVEVLGDPTGYFFHLYFPYIQGFIRFGFGISINIFCKC